VEDLFTLARADAGNYPVRMQPLYFDELIHEVVAAARILAATRQVTIDVTQVPPVSITGDEELLRRLIVNLLDNAIRHSPDGGRVHVELHATDARCHFTVTDSGPGIPEESQPHIFERFYRVDASRARGGTDGGAGLGLALVRWVATVHGGEVELSRSSAQGSSFTVVLPLRT
jgi:two-component system, OmpR family, sensor kinase